MMTTLYWKMILFDVVKKEQERKKKKHKHKARERQKIKNEKKEWKKT